MTRAESPPDPLDIRREGADTLLSIPRQPVAPLGGSRYRLRVEVSEDLQSWRDFGELGTDGAGRLRLPAAVDQPRRFFRLAPVVEVLPGEVNGAETFGFSRVFDEEVQRVGWLTPEAFAAAVGKEFEYLAGIDFDPETARYWEAFNADPAVVNLGKTREDPGYRLTDFRLKPAEMEFFRRQGFVVSERLGGDTFAKVFYSVFSDDLPVFISTDSALHAWHLTYQRILAELEETELAGMLGDLLNGLHKEIQSMQWSRAAILEGPLRQNFIDADYFLAVGRSLLQADKAPAGVSPVLGPHPGVQETLKAIRELRLYGEPPGFEMFGAGRLMDFTQFTPRGHYLRSQQLSNYFKAYLWTSRADFRVSDPEQPEQSRREFRTAAVLSLLLRQLSGPTPNAGMDLWQGLEDVVRLFVGRSDGMNFAQLNPLLTAAGITSLASITNVSQLDQLHQTLLQGNLGVQLYAGDVHASPFGPEQAQLPRTFVFTGQRFVADGWAFSQVTFDRVPWYEDIPGATFFQKVLRRVPNTLDAAYAVLGNRQVGREIAERMQAPRVPGNFRDGYPYAHRLEALAGTFDRFTPQAWTDSLYTRWLAALRELSGPTSGPEFPQAMRTRAWMHHALNTQLASYAELKHDTLLYGKQAYASSILCDYPAGFVEPLPRFWERMRELSDATAAGLRRIESVREPGVAEIRPAPPSQSTPWGTYLVNIAERRQKRLATLAHFSATMGTLGTLAAKELRQEPFSTADTEFIRGLMNEIRRYGGPTYDGWYPRLFYDDLAQESGNTATNGSNKFDALVADIFTAPPDQKDPLGGVLHVATGAVDLLMIAVDNGPDRMVYAGPVMSYYEFLEPGPTLRRLNNEEWQARLRTNTVTRPEWTRDHVVRRP